jgi:hypothetical protein
MVFIAGLGGMKMKDKRDDGGPAFPLPRQQWDSELGGGFRETQEGVTLRDYFAIHGPEPLDGDVEFQRQLDRNRNPYNESHKPKIRSDKEIRAALRYEYADAMLEARK